MTLHEFQTRARWPQFEASLLAQGWEPHWDPGIEAFVEGIGVPCAVCGQRPVYVGMRKARYALAFVVCQEPCGTWFWFIAPHAGPREGDAV